MDETRKYTDPLGRECRKYPPGMTGTPESRKIYGAWRNIMSAPHCEEWDDYPTFYNWSIANGFSLESRIFRNDRTAPFSPENCLWDTQGGEAAKLWAGVNKAEVVAGWNRTVNVLRRHCGLEPFEVPEVPEDEE